jgi:hypothetical protein
MDGLLESIALRDAAALENAFYDLKGDISPRSSSPPRSGPRSGTSTLVAVPEGEEGLLIKELRVLLTVYHTHHYHWFSALNHSVAGGKGKAQAQQQQYLSPSNRYFFKA